MESVVVAFGRTQSGKSTTLGKVRKANQAMPRVGDGDGESVTEQASIIDTELGLMLDTPGIDDTKLRFTDDEAGRRVAIGMAVSGRNRAKFIIFESLANDAMQLRGTLEKLSRTFGALALGAAVVLASKSDMLVDAARRERRLQKIREVVEQAGLQGVVLWQNEGLDDAGHAGQLAALRGKLDSFDGVAIVELEDLQQRQLARAQQKCDAHPTQTRTVDVEVEEQYTEPRAVQEPYEEPYVEPQSYMEDYEAPEIYDEPVQHSYTYKKRRGGVAGFFGDTKSCTGCTTVMSQKVRMVNKQRSATRDVTKYRTAHRTVTHHDTKTRTVTQSRVVEYRLPVDDFMGAALNEIIEEVRQSLTA